MQLAEQFRPRLRQLDDRSGRYALRQPSKGPRVLLTDLEGLLYRREEELQRRLLLLSEVRFYVRRALREVLRLEEVGDLKYALGWL